VLSRGQLKMLVGGLYLAQAEMLQSKTTKQSIFLVDDLTAELDEESCRRLCVEFERLDIQVLATSIKRDDLIGCWARPEQLSLFHVEHGIIKPMSLAL
jgi:DNA replication and repair protein RecF